MLLLIFKVKETVKASAYKVAIYNLVLFIFLNGLLGLFDVFAYYTYDEDMADEILRLTWLELALNLCFLPFAIALAIGIKKDKLRWIDIWVKAKVVQASYIILLNLVIIVFLITDFNVDDAVVVLIYTVLLEVVYLENIMYMSGYYRHRTTEENDLEAGPEVLKF